MADTPRQATVMTQAREAAVLTFESVCKDYRSDGQRVRALQDVTLALPPGVFAVLVGRSGCGKSTLLNLAGAMDFPTSGRVRLDGKETSSLSDAGLTRLRREKIGFVFQSFQLLHTLTAVENVELPLLLAGHPDARARSWERLQWVGIAHLAERYPHQLSGGEMQRVAIARALVQSPALLLADEPTGNLDSSTGSLILRLLRRISEQHATSILMATHSAEAAAEADLVFRMRDGRIEDLVRR